jgi:hypothetical protein
LFSLKNPQLFKTVDVSRGGVCDWIITNYENEKDKWIMAKTEDIKNNMINFAQTLNLQFKKASKANDQALYEYPSK